MGSGSASAATTAGFTMPAEAPPHGAPVRQYINSKITGVLLEGMKMVARDQYVFAVLAPPFSFPQPPSPRRLRPPLRPKLSSPRPNLTKLWPEGGREISGRSKTSTEQFC